MADLLPRDHPELRSFVLSNVRLTGTRIGAGAYGSVEEVEIPGAVCAAKKIHDIFQDRSQIPVAEIRKASTQFVKECQLMSTLRHPHIVQFLGVCFLPGSRLPALVMELLLTSLHDLLDPDTGDSEPPPDAPKPFFPLGLKRSILHDVARGLAYLHDRSPPIIHRDLSAKNVLLNSAMVAKIADLGVARIVPRMRTAATMTKAPGAFIYMPPEALEAKSEDEEDSSKYDASIDIFSFGVVAIFTLSQTFPCNLLAPNYRENRRHIARTELERRDQYMQKIYSQLRKDHPLIQMIKRCLDFPEDRPDIREVLRLLEQARAEIRDDESDMNKLELVRALHRQPRNQSLERDLQTRVRENADLQQQVQTVAQQLSRKEAELTRAEETIGREQQQNQELREQGDVKQREKIQLQQQLRQQEAERDELVQAKDRELAQAQQQLRQLSESSRREIGEIQLQNQELRQQEQSSRRELRSSEALVADFQKSLQQRDSELETLRTPSAALPSSQPRTLATRDTSYTTQLVQPPQPHPGPIPPVRADPNSLPPSTQRKLTVQCHTQKKKAPCIMYRGSAIADLNVVYCSPGDSNSVYRYQLREDQWNDLPSCSHRDSGLVVIDGVLTAVGGWDGSYTNKLFTLRQSRWVEKYPRWVEKYPPMNTARSKPAVVSTSDGQHMNVIAIGGYGDGVGGWIDAVELYNTGSSTWSQITSLPQPLTFPSATICDNQLYVIGGDGNGYSCSLQALLSSDQPISSQSMTRSLTWTPLPRLPVTWSTAATLCGQLVIIGGKRDGSPVNSIHQLVDGQWVNIGSMSSVRRLCLVASPSPDKMVVVGGFGAFIRNTCISSQVDSVEVCVAV